MNSEQNKMKKPFFQSKYLLGALFISISLVFSPVWAANMPKPVTPEVQALEQKLNDDEKHIFMAQEQLEKLKQQDAEKSENEEGAATISERDLAKLRLNAESARVVVDNLILELGAVNQSISTIQSDIAGLTKEMASLRAAKRTKSEQEQYEILGNAIAEKRAVLTLAENREPLLRQLLNISEEISSIYEQHLLEAQHLLATAQTENRENRQVELQAQLVQQQQEFQTMAAKIRNRLQALAPQLGENAPQRIELQNQLFEAEERAALMEMKLAYSQLSIRIANLDPIPEEGFYSPAKAREVDNNIRSLLDALQEQNQRIENKITLLQRLENVSQQRELLGLIAKPQAEQQQQIYKSLLTGYQNEVALGNELTAHVLSYQDQFKQAAAQGISVMQKLPTTFAQWRQLGSELQAIPGLLFTEIRYLVAATIIQIKTAHPFRLFVLLLSQLVWVVGCYHVSSIFKRLLIEQKTESKQYNFSSFAWHVLVQLLVRNGRALTLLGAIFLLMRILSVPRGDVNLIILLVLIGLLFKFALDIARYVLLESIRDHQGNDVKLYHSLRWGLTLGGILTLLTALAHSLPISAEATGFIDRLFMLVLLGVSFPLLKSAELLPNLLMPYREKHIYLYRAGRVVSFLAPLIVMSTAIIGLVGYVDLAWRIGMIEGQFLLVLLAWMVARGMVGDIMDWLADRLITEVRNGWVWSEAFLKPLHRFINLLLLFAAIIALCVVYGQYSQVQVFAWIAEKLYRPIYSNGEITIAVINVLAFILFSSVVIWLAKWSREFSYRWLYSSTTEPGLRNSLAVFTQYTAVGVGLIFILRLVGINLTTLTVVLGALGLGVGIGLRDIFNNFVSGVLILLERPVRTGDYVKVGEYEGEIIHIGMRAVTVKTPDNIDVLVPNSQLMSNSFTNWTYNDSVVRIATPVRIAFESDIHQAHQVILKVLQQNPDVLRDPEPLVLIQELAESNILLSVRFFINMKVNMSLSYMRSVILFNILDALKEAGIPLAVPRRGVTLEDKREER
jgi:potassium efflux system protein